ncbi:hypothetical protein Tco_0367077 [Tanacetum coccineum]
MSKFNGILKLKFIRERSATYATRRKKMALQMHGKETQFKKFFDSKEVNATDHENRFLQKYFKDIIREEPQTFRVRQLQYLDELEMLFDERAHLIEDLWMREREVKAIKEIEKQLNEQKMQTQEHLVTEGAALEASLVTEGIALEDNLIAKESTDDSVPSSEQLDESSKSENDTDVEKILVEMVASSIEHADIRPSYDSDMVSKVHHDTFEYVFAHSIQNYVQPESTPDTYMVNENNSNIISDIPNMDPVRDKEEHDYVDDEQQRAFFDSLVNDLKCEVENCTKVNRKAQAFALRSKNNVENPFILNKAKELTPSLYNIDEMGKDLLKDHKIISEEELKCEGEKRLKVKQRKSLLSYHGFIYGETQCEKPLKVPLKRKNVNLKEHLEQAQLRNYDPKLWKRLPMKYFCHVK